MTRDALPTVPYEISADELRRAADRADAAALELLLVALDLRKIADSIDEAGTKRLTK